MPAQTLTPASEPRSIRVAVVSMRKEALLRDTTEMETETSIDVTQVHAQCRGNAGGCRTANRLGERRGLFLE